MATRPLVEFRALLRGQDLTDALAPGLPELLLLRLALVLPLGAAQGVALAAVFVEDRVEPGNLILRQPEARASASSAAGSRVSPVSAS